MLSPDPIEITDNAGNTVFNGPREEARAFVHNRAVDQFPIFVHVRFEDEHVPRIYVFRSPNDLN